MKRLLALTLSLAAASPAYSLNFKGHYVVCRLAWLQTNEQHAPA